MSKFLNVLFFSSMLMTACSEKTLTPECNLIPYPNHLATSQGEFKITSNVKLNFPENADDASMQVINNFIQNLQSVADVKLISDVAAQKSREISFVNNPELGKEEYKISIQPDKVLVQAATANGFFYATLTLKQMLPLAVYGSEAKPQENWSLPCVEIQDKPRFEYRGMHLDVSRHFFSKEEVKRYIDIMAAYKLNKFHWHLTDDQGWRIEIKKYPELTSIGGIRKKTMIKKDWDNYDHTPYGGFYTQDEIREIVQYASDRFITVIPEIDLPGHMMAALASYPSLGCVGKDYEVSGQWGVRDDVLCVGKESTFDFIENVLTEVVDLFPSEYIHIGGDECPKVRWEKCPTCQKKIKELRIKGDEKHKPEHYLQSYVISRVEKFLNAKGRRIIGWDEILEGGLAPNATVMSWRGMDGGIEAARQGNDVIMTPSSHLYFDHYQSNDTENEPFSIGGCSPVERVYSFEPVAPVLTPEESKHILGTQANLWTEYIPSVDQLHYQLLPRLAALSEVQWTNPESKSWERFINNLDRETKMYDMLGYNYAQHIYEIQGEYIVNNKDKGVTAKLVTMGDAPIYYTTDGTTPTEKSQLYTEPILINESCTLQAVTKRNDKLSRVLNKGFKFNKATGNKVSFNVAPNPKYTYKGATALVDGIRGDFNYANGCWLGYENIPLDVNIGFYEPTELSSVKIGSLVQFGEYVFPPTKLTVYGANENGTFEQLGETQIPMTTSEDKDGLYEYTCEFPAFKTKELRVVVDPVSSIPDWHGARGEKAFIFVDEIIVD
ncbi:MAG: family 20 glycosylhydrolase [Bacteroidales bacterium]